MSVPLPLLLVALIAALTGAVFSGTDSALVRISVPRRHALLEQAETRHKAALARYAQHAYRMRATYLVGRIASVCVTAMIVADIAGRLVAGPSLGLLAILLTVLSVAPLWELGAALASRRGDTLGPALATYLRPFEFLFYPIAAPLGRLAERLTARFDQEPEEADTHIKKSIISAEVEFMVDQGEKSGIVGAEPAEMIRNVLGFADLKAKDIMVPRNRVEGIEAQTSLEAIRRLVAESGHSRYPVYDGQLDNIVGILCAKDVFKADVTALAKKAASIAPPSDGHPKAPSVPPPAPAEEPAAKEPVTARDILRPETFFVHETQSLASILREMRSKRHHLAVVVDEFGGTSGIATLEDVLERIVGDIRDEHDEAEAAPIQDLGDGRLFANPDVSMGDLSAYLGADIPEDAQDEPLRSVLKRESDQPEIGMSIEKYGLQFIVRDMDGADVQRIEVVRPGGESLSGPPKELAPTSSADRP